MATVHSSYVGMLIRTPLAPLRSSAAALCASLLASFFMFTSLLTNYKGTACSRRLHVGFRSTPARRHCSKNMRHLGLCTRFWSALDLCAHDAELGIHGCAAALGMVDSARKQRGEAGSGGRHALNLAIFHAGVIDCNSMLVLLIARHLLCDIMCVRGLSTRRGVRHIVLLTCAPHVEQATQETCRSYAI